MIKMSSWDKSVGDVISEIKMMGTNFKGFYWLVEGPSDIRFFTSRKKADVEIIAAGGKYNVIQAMRELDGDPIKSRVLGIVDADIEWLIPDRDRPEGVISTDPRDIEGMLIRSTALNKLLAEYADPEKILSFELGKKTSVREYVHDVAELFGKVRAANELFRKVKLKKLKPQIFISKDSWEYDFEQAMEFCVRLGAFESVEDLRTRISLLPHMDDWHYVRGHDAVNILTGGLIKQFGRGGTIDEARVESALRLGIEEYEYQSTNLYQSLEAWYTRN